MVNHGANIRKYLYLKKRSSFRHMLTKVVLLGIVYPMYYINIEWIFSTPCILCLENRNRSRYVYYTIKFNSCKMLYFSTFSQQHYLNHSHCCKFVSPQNVCLIILKKNVLTRISQTITMTINVLMGWTLASIRENVFSGMRTYRFETNLKWQILYLDSYYLDLKNTARQFRNK